MFRFFESLLDPYPGGEPEMPPRRLAAFLMYYSRPLLPWLVLVTILTAVVSVMEVIFFAWMGTLVDWLAEAERETFLTDHGMALTGMALLILVGFPVAIALQSLVMHQTVFGNYPMLARWLSHRYLLRQDMSFFQDDFAGRISQKVMQTALAIRESVTHVIDVLVYVVVYFTGAVILAASADPRLAVPLLLWLAAYIAILVHFVPRLKHISALQAEARAGMTGRIVDTYTNMQTVKLFAHTQGEQEYARSAMDGLMQTVHPQMRLVTQLTVWLHVINSLLLVSIAGLAILGWLQAAISLGAIAVAVALIMRLRAMSQWVLWEVASLFEYIGTVQDGMATIARPIAIADRPDAADLAISRGEVRFEGVQFRYDPETPVIEGLTLGIRPGEKIGLVGRSGAGKSTLINLLLRFYEPNTGRILIDGQDVSDVTQDSLRRHIGMVTQDTSLLHRSVRDNIRYGRPDASQTAIEEAARRAHAHDFILALRDPQGRTGYDAHVGERGIKLSGGQRQRIAIARVLLKDAPILILDEATSALDSEIEAAIQEQLYALMEGKTVIAIAHRLSTIAMLDRLVVMECGRIVESGTHASLLRSDGLYAGLWRRQSGGFLGNDLGDGPTDARQDEEKGER